MRRYWNKIVLRKKNKITWQKLVGNKFKNLFAFSVLYKRNVGGSGKTFRYVFCTFLSFAFSASVCLIIPLLYIVIKLRMYQSFSVNTFSSINTFISPILSSSMIFKGFSLYIHEFDTRAAHSKNIYETSLNNAVKVSPG